MTTSTLEKTLGLSTPAVAIAFRDAPPAGVRRGAPQPASCGYWKLAASGEVFYTVPDDHLSCAVGAYTHGAPMSPEKGKELEGLVQTMVGLEYISMDEVAKIPRRPSGFGAVVYGPLAAFQEKVGGAIDVVLVKGDARQLMLLTEAAQRAGVVGDFPMMGRPTCAVLPQAMASDRTAASFGCVGNRVYTGAGASEAYMAIPGDKLSAVEEKLQTIVRANQELEKFHEGRKAEFRAKT